MINTHLSIRVSDEYKSKLETIIRLTNKNVSEIVREGIDLVFEQVLNDD